jgi:uncharacterized protein (UPF0332 family)
MPPDPDRLFEQADLLTDNLHGETDLRRAISAAYYAVFHFILRAAADLVCGAANRATPRYNLAYSVDHKRLKTVCEQLKASKINDKVKPYEPVGGFGEIADFAKLALILYEQRIQADYDLLRHFTVRKAQLIVIEARNAIRKFEAANRRATRDLPDAVAL